MPLTARRALVSVAAAVATTSLATSGLLAPSVEASPALPPGTYSAPEYLPLKGSHQVGCTYNNGCAGGYHGYPAIDLAAGRGESIFPAGAGQVVQVVRGGVNCPDDEPPFNCAPHQYTNRVVIDHGGGVFTRYLHFDTVDVNEGDWVDIGNRLGGAGDSGPSTPGYVHLHFERVHGSPSGTKVDPGQLKACFNNGTTATYPAAWGYSSWNQVPHHARSTANDGCTRPSEGGPGPRSLAKSGGFETGTGWASMASTNFVRYTSGQVHARETPRSGTQYGAFNTSIDGGGIYQDIPATIQPGDTYCASAFVRAQAGGTASGTFALWLIGNTTPESASESYRGLGTFQKWTPLSTCVTATSPHSAIRVQFYPTPNGGTTDADDVMVTRSLAKSGGFETGTGWASMASTNFVTYAANQPSSGEAPRSGSRYGAFNTSIDGGGIYQDIPATIQPGDTYCASAFVRAQAGGTASGTFALWLIGQSAAENGSVSYTALQTRRRWSPVSTCVSATSPHNAIRVQFYPTPNRGTTHADDVNVARSLATSGGFETGTGWATMASTNFVRYASGQVHARETPRSGSRYGAFNTSISGGGIYQDIPATIQPGDTYCASTFVRAQAGGTASGTFALWLIGQTTPESSNQPYANLGNYQRWTPLSTCVTATSPHNAIRLQFYPTPNGGTTDADDISITLNPAVESKPLNIRPPTVEGVKRVGRRLTAHRGSWVPSHLPFQYQWLRDGSPIRNATSATYLLKRADAQHRISVRISTGMTGYTTGAITSPKTRRIRR